MRVVRFDRKMEILKLTTCFVMGFLFGGLCEKSCSAYSYMVEHIGLIEMAFNVFSVMLIISVVILALYIKIKGGKKK